jgi:hypothetical protein
MVARWLMERRERPQQGQQDVSSAESLPRSRHGVSDNFFAHAARKPRPRLR